MKAPPFKIFFGILCQTVQKRVTISFVLTQLPLRLLPLVLFLVFMKFETNAPSFQREKGFDKSCIILRAITVNNDLTRIRDYTTKSLNIFIDMGYVN